MLAYNASKEKANIGAKNQSTSIFTRDLNELFASTLGTRKEWFIKSKYFKTMIAIVPNEIKDQWIAGYEFLNEYIVPKCDYEYPVKLEQQGYTIRRILFFERETDHTVQEAKRKFGVTLREFNYDADQSRQVEADRKLAEQQSAQDLDQLTKACVESFRDIYSTYIHVKVGFFPRS